MKRSTFYKNTILYFIISIALSIFIAGGSDSLAAISSYHTSPASPESSNPSIVPQNGIFELTLADQVTYGAQENFFEVDISVTFTSPSPSYAITTVHGFYYDTLRGGTSLWKVRFSPSETGTYNYSYVFTHNQSGDQSGSGSFQVISGSNPGFIRQNPSNKFRWEFSNGEPFYPYGFNGVGGFNDIQLTDGGDRNGAFAEGRAITNDEHLRIFSNAGFNMIRFSQDNGNTPLLTGERDKYDVYDKDAAIYHDWYLQKLRSNNFRIFYGLFGFEYNMENSPSSERLAFVRYAVDRWAAYVDVWEILNESHAPNYSWQSTIANVIRARDPYNHPISTNWEIAALNVPEIDITSPHKYSHENELTSDQYVVNNYAAVYKGWNKPIILGEQGNTDMNWLPDSALRMRLRGWTTFFKELSILFWETSYATNGVANAGGIANIYLGHEERQYAHIMMWFVDQVLKPNSVEASVQVSNPNLMRAYGLSSSDGFAAYIHHYADHTNTVSGQTITFNAPQAGQGYWIDPKTGNKLAPTVTVSSGSNTLPIPNFTVDIAFFSTASLGDTKPIAHVAIDNPDKDGDLDGDGKTDYGPAVMPFGMPGFTLNLDASDSHDLDGGTVIFSWDYGDGSTGSGASVSHTYPDGVHLTTLSVTDDEGNVSKHSFLVRATADPNPNQNNPPIFKFPSNSISVREGEPVYITALANDRELVANSYVGAPGDLTYSASTLPEGAIFGQGKATWGNQLYWVPDVDQAGSYQVQFNVQDAQGASVQKTITINVSDVFNITNAYAITASAGAGGTILPSGSVPVSSGASQTFTITANSGYSIADVLVDGASVGAQASYPFTNVTADHTIAASFYDNTTSYIITATAGTGGNISPSGTVVVSQGASRTFTITAGTGYSIAEVLVDGTSVGTPTSHTFTNVTDNHSIAASFAIKTYTLTVNATNGYVTRSPDKENYNHGVDIILEAFADIGYSFSNWSGALSGSANPATIFDMDSNKTVTANFVIDDDPPMTSDHIPAKNSFQAAIDTIIQLHIADTGSGVEYESITIRVEGKVIYNGAADINGTYNSTMGICSRVGTESDYTFVFQLSVLFEYEQEVNVEIAAEDQAGNPLTEDYSFHTVMRTFGKNVKVNSDTGTLAQNNPATARDSSDNIWIVWDQTTAAGDTDIYIGKLPANGSAFMSSVPVIKAANNQSNPAIAIDGNTIYVVWHGNAPNGHWDIFTSTSTNGTSWSSPVKVNSNDTDNENDQTSPIIAIDGNAKAYIAWEDIRTGDKDIWVATFTGGSTWTLERVTEDSSHQTEPAIAIDDRDDTAYIVWTDRRNFATTGTDIYEASSASWTDSLLVNANGNQSSPVGAISGDGDLHLLWVDESGYDEIIYGSGTPFVGISIVDEANSNQSAPSIAADGTKVFACWQDFRNVSNNADTDIYYVEKTGSNFGTNILVNDDIGTYTQTSPVIGTNKYGNPYIVWVDNREGNNDIYYAGAMSVGPALETVDVTASSGGTVAVNSSLQVYIPPGALSADTTVTIAEMVNPPEPPSGTLGEYYEFSPGGLQFNTPVTVTLPHTSSECPGYSTYWVYWYNAETDLWTQNGITNVQHVVLSSTLHAVRFQTTHFTGFGAGGSVGGVVSVGGGGGGGGGGCAISANGRGNVIEYMLPYVFYVVVLLLIKLKDARNRKAI